MNLMQEQVAEFHAALEVMARDTPTTLSSNERQLRASLILEETREVLESLGYAITVGYDDDEAPYFFAKETSAPPQHVALQVKELCDLLYVVFGTFVTMGIEAQPFFTAVHENNMTKAGGEVRADGKRLKPPGYKPINLVMQLRRHAFENCRTCQDYNGDGPPHFASIRCESGAYNHCSCDTCF